MTEQEQKDLAETNAAVQRAKNNFFEMARTIERATPAQMEQMGYGRFTKGEVVLKLLEYYQKEIKKLHDAHVRKYPD